MRHPSEPKGPEGRGVDRGMHGRFLELAQVARATTLGTQEQRNNQVPIGDTNTLDQSRDWHNGTSVSADTDATFSDRPKADPRPQRRGPADSLDWASLPTVAGGGRPGMRNQADGGSSPSPRHSHEGAQGPQGVIRGADIYYTDDQLHHLDTSADGPDDRTNHHPDLHHDRISHMETRIEEAADHRGGSEGPKAKLTPREESSRRRAHSENDGARHCGSSRVSRTISKGALAPQQGCGAPCPRVG